MIKSKTAIATGLEKSLSCSIVLQLLIAYKSIKLIAGLH